MKLRCSYSKRQVNSIVNFAKQELIVHYGPFGVGKTRSLVFGFGLYCMRLQELGNNLTFVLAGRTQQSVKRNMCNVLSELFGSDFQYTGSKKDGKDKDAVLFGQNLYLIGFNDTSSREKFQGITDIMGILHDECTLCKEEDFEYALGRLRGEVLTENSDANVEDDDADYVDVPDDMMNSLKYVKLPEGTVPHWYIGSCNPDNPKHFIKKKIDEGALIGIKWYRKDAIWFGSKKYYARLAKQYKGNPAFFARYLNGEWTSANKMVYCMFNPKVHIVNLASLNMDIPNILSNAKRSFISVDYGSDHPTAILLGSLMTNKNYIISKEIKLTNKAPSDIILSISNLIKYLVDSGGKLDAIYVDPSAKALKDEMKKNGMSYINAMNRHSDGIGCVQSLLSTEQLFILSTCENLIGEIYTYHYKDTTNGQDEVFKLDDDFVDSMRYGVYTDSATHSNK